MNVLFVADPIEKTNIKTDTSLLLLREFIAKGASVYWTTADRLSWLASNVHCSVRAVVETGSSEAHPRLSDFEDRVVTDFQHVIIRKEPPFDEAYQRLCWLLAPYENRILISNKASVLLLHHEKMLPLTAVATGVLKPQQIITTCVTDCFEVAKQFVRELKMENVIMKPWLGHGGRDIQLLEAQGFLDEAEKYFETQERWMLQPFEEEIFERGDRRVIFLGGSAVADFVRLPKKGHFVSNLIRGGQAFLREMDSEEKKLTQALEPWLKKLGIDFAGADYINGKLSEINITSPTGIKNYEDLSGKDLGVWVVEYLLKASLPS